VSQRAFLTNKSERTFLKVIDVAIELFEKKGFHETSMRDISRESGLALGALYYYCHSKEELVLHFYERISSQIEAKYLAMKPETKSFGQAYLQFVRVKLTKLSRFRDLLIVLMKESVDPQSPLSPLHQDNRKIRTANFQLLAVLAGRSGVEQNKCEDAAKVLWLLHLGILAFWLYDRSPGYAATEKLMVGIASLLDWYTVLKKLPGFEPMVRPISSALFAILD
jgi:AcrR family transcriptional regulator